MRKTLTVLAEGDRAEPTNLPTKGKGWVIAESRLDTLHETAREMRRNPAAAQAALAAALGRVELGKYKFRQHVVIGSAIVDFACQALRVVVQIEDQAKGDPAIDRRRDKSLEVTGNRVLRYPAADVLADADGVAATIFAEMKKTYDERRSRPRAGSGSSYSRDRSQGAGRGYQR